MHTFARKPKAAEQTTSAKSTMPGLAHFKHRHDVDSILYLQRTIENQAVQQRLESNTKNGEGHSTTTETARFGHDFSRIPVHATAPINSVFPLQAGITKAEGKPGSGAEKLIDGGTTPAAEDAGPAIRPDGDTLQATPMDAPTPAPAPPVSPPNPPPPPVGTPWKAGVHLTPTFTVTETEGTRSNADPATTNVDTPTFTGGAAVDGGAGMWRYQLRSVEGTGRIKFVYYTADHYPAPTPNDDSGELSNVTKLNWNNIVTDLESHKTGVAGDWSAYRRTILHERYHWAKEWQGSVKTELIKAENDIEKEGVSFAAAADATAAEKVLAPRVKRIFDAAMAAARTVYNALGDSSGDPPYVAGSVGAVDLAARVKAHAVAKKW